MERFKEIKFEASFCVAVQSDVPDGMAYKIWQEQLTDAVEVIAGRLCVAATKPLLAISGEGA